MLRIKRRPKVTGDHRLTTIETRLASMEAMLKQLLKAPATDRASYSVEEVAEMLGKAPFTVREWCRDGRINASKRAEKRGGTEMWSISAQEVTRYQNDGLLPTR